MNIFSKLSQLFTSAKMPDDVKSAFDASKNTRDLLVKLDTLSTRNEVEIKTLEKEMLSLGQMEDAEADKIRSGKLSETEKKLSLMQIKRLRKRRSNIEDRVNIYDRNINLHLNLIGKVQQIEAMQLKGVDPEEIDTVMIDFEQNFESYTEAAAALTDFEKNAKKFDTDDKDLRQIEKELSNNDARIERDAELAKLEAEILGEKKLSEKDEPTAKNKKLAEE